MYLTFAVQFEAWCTLAACMHACMGRMQKGQRLPRYHVLMSSLHLLPEFHPFHAKKRGIMMSLRFPTGKPTVKKS